jgi:hypothetical protein
MVKIIKKKTYHRAERALKDCENLDGTGQVRYKNGKIYPDQKPVAIPVKFRRQGATTEEKFMKRLQNRIAIQKAMMEPGLDSPEAMNEFALQIDAAFDGIKDKFMQGTITPYEVTEMLSEFRMEDNLREQHAREQFEMDRQGESDNDQDRGDNSDSTNSMENPSEEVTHPHNRREG